jgi:hypothetical protein
VQAYKKRKVRIALLGAHGRIVNKTMRKHPNLSGFIYLATLILAISVPCAFATTLIGLHLPDGFIIAVDSKVTYKGTGIQGPPTVCKIFQSGSLYFAFSGLANDRNSGFFPEQIVANSFSANDSLANNLDRMDRALSDALTIEMQRLKTQDPVSFAFNHRPGADTLQIVAGEMLNDTPQMFGRGFQYVEETGKIDISRLSCPGVDCPTEVKFFLAGDTDIARVMVNQFFQETQTAHDPVADTRKLVEAEIIAAPETVGPPITILRVDKNGASWPSNDSSCPIVVTSTRP